MVAVAKLIETVNLCFTHIGKTQPTLQDINLELYPGEIVFLGGATGSGKSTLLNCLTGISPHHIGGKFTGDILYENNSILELSVRERSQYIGTILQNVETQIFTDKVIDEVIFGLENLNISPEIITQITHQSLQEFGLLPQQNWLISQLSAGQKQRLIIACVLAMNQPVLLLDEPFAYLDRGGSELLLQLLVERSHQGQTVLLIEHRRDLVNEICDSTYYFDQGKIHSGTPKTFFPQLSVTSSPTLSHIILQTHQLSWGGYLPFPDLELHSGEIILLQGENGCGKTTLLKLLSGLLKPTTGNIEICGQSIIKKSVVQIAKNIGFVLQNPNHQLFAETVYQEVVQASVSAHLGEELLEKLNLKSLSELHPQSLSQGQKRRLALAAVLARRPKICLLDEITVGQDPQSLTLMLQVLIDFTKQGAGLILTSHDQQIANYLPAKTCELVPYGMARR
ncbi:MAG: ABC transporter ATP-binding protein [Nodularia sp. (in: Bacteria)]|nr:MAG: ABC transporter ATP-binding protein [Nodularia sp. (in: cyanobacteria)]